MESTFPDTSGHWFAPNDRVRTIAWLTGAEFTILTHGIRATTSCTPVQRDAAYMWVSNKLGFTLTFSCALIAYSIGTAAFLAFIFSETSYQRISTVSFLTRAFPSTADGIFTTSVATWTSPWVTSFQWIPFITVSTNARVTSPTESVSATSTTAATWEVRR